MIPGRMPEALGWLISEYEGLRDLVARLEILVGESTLHHAAKLVEQGKLTDETLAKWRVAHALDPRLLMTRVVLCGEDGRLDFPGELTFCYDTAGVHGSQRRMLLNSLMGLNQTKCVFMIQTSGTPGTGNGSGLISGRHTKHEHSICCLPTIVASVHAAQDPRRYRHLDDQTSNVRQQVDVQRPCHRRFPLHSFLCRDRAGTP